MPCGRYEWHFIILEGRRHQHNTDNSSINWLPSRKASSVLYPTKCEDELERKRIKLPHKRTRPYEKEEWKKF
jgi:hypothetical protein